MRTLLPSALILLIFLVLAGLSSQGTLPNPILYLRIDLAGLAILLGLALSALAAGGLALRGRVGRIGQLARAQAAADRRRFLRRLDHELKNPLTAIRAGLANLAAFLGPGTQQSTLASVQAETLRLSRLTSDLRKLAELETQELERAPVDLAQLLSEASSLAQEQPHARGRRLTLTLPQAPWPLPTVSGDWDLLFLAVYNLLDNALKFTQPGDTVEVRASEDGAAVVLQVADTGPGIPQAELPYVWQELYRGQGARGVRGSGLGLALVQAIVQRHGGQTSLRSKVGQGTVVTLRLPVE